MLPRTRSTAAASTARRLRLAPEGAAPRSDELRACEAGLVAALVEAERRVPVGHQSDIDRNSRDPAVEAEDEVEDRRG